jgi:hypothetical protein
MRAMSTAGAVCAALAFAAAPGHAHGGPSGAGNQYPYWYTATGVQMPPPLIESMAADPPCGAGVTLLRIGSLPGAAARTYVRDPQGQFPESTLAGPYVERAEMPYGAVETGLHQDGQDLLLTRDGSFAYLVGERGVERWPAATGPDPACD